MAPTAGPANQAQEAVGTVSSTEMKNHLGAVLRQVTRTGGPLLIARAGKPVAVVLSVAAYEAKWHPRPARVRIRRELARAAFGMWDGRSDIDDKWVENGRRRWRSEWEDE